MKAAMRLGFLLVVAGCGFQSDCRLRRRHADNDHTLHAMRDEMARAKTRLELKIPGTDTSRCARTTSNTACWIWICAKWSENSARC